MKTLVLDSAPKFPRLAKNKELIRSVEIETTEFEKGIKTQLEKTNQESVNLTQYQNNF